MPKTTKPKSPEAKPEKPKAAKPVARKPAAKPKAKRATTGTAAKPVKTARRGKASSASELTPAMASAAAASLPVPAAEPSPAPVNESLEQVLLAVEAAREKKARQMRLLDLRDLADFTDYFFVCSGTNPRQVQAICDEIDTVMRRAGLRATHIEGYNHAEWVLLDYVDFVAHVFTEQAREYYDLERLWRTATRIPLAED